MKLIDKDAVLAEIENVRKHYIERDDFDIGWNYALDKVLSFLDTFEVKEVDLEKEIELVKGDYEQVDVAWNNDFDYIAKHFFELGMRVNNPITAADRGTAEEIIINLKRVEKDYRINLTKEITWVRNKAQKGEKV